MVRMTISKNYGTALKKICHFRALSIVYVIYVHNYIYCRHPKKKLNRFCCFQPTMLFLLLTCTLMQLNRKSSRNLSFFHVFFNKSRFFMFFYLFSCRLARMNPDCGQLFRKKSSAVQNRPLSSPDAKITSPGGRNSPCYRIPVKPDRRFLLQFSIHSII